MSEKRQRQFVIQCRVNAEEREQIKDDAARLGVTVGSYVRGVLLDAPIPRQARRPSVEVNVLRELLGKLGKVGNNLNQLARERNSDLPVYSEDVYAVLTQIQAVAEQIVRTLKMR